MAFSDGRGQPRSSRRRRPETTTLHRIVREHLETYLALANESDPMGDGVPDYVEKEFSSRLKCGMTSASPSCNLHRLASQGRGASPSTPRHHPLPALQVGRSSGSDL